MKNKKLIITGAIALFLIAFVCIGIFGKNGVANKENNSDKVKIDETVSSSVNSAEKNDSSEAVSAEVDADIPVPTYVKPDPEMMLPEMRELYEQNNDFYGKLTIEGTVIDYPVMYSGDDFYINHNFYKNNQRSGSLYIDRYCMANPRGTNLIIHGHNMKSGIMFGTLEEYKQEEYYKEHPTIKFTTLYEEEEYEIFAAFKSQVFKKTDTCFKYYKFYNAANKEEFDSYVDNCLALAFYDTGIRPEYGDRLIALSTCEYSVTNGRMVVVARKINN